MATPLIQKLGIKAGFRLYLQAPISHYYELLGPLPAGAAEIDPQADHAQVDFIHFFVQEEAKLHALLPTLKARLKPNAMLWISWPKKTSALASDLDRDLIREIGLAAGLVDVKVCAIDQDWSGLKFVYRTKDRCANLLMC
jgi:hypothetical protein